MPGNSVKFVCPECHAPFEWVMPRGAYSYTHLIQCRDCATKFVVWARAKIETVTFRVHEVDADKYSFVLTDDDANADKL